MSINLTKAYRNGTTPTQEQMTKLFSSLETAVNVTKLDSSNFQDSALASSSFDSDGITKNSIASSAITQAKCDSTVTTLLVPIGAVFSIAASSAPSGWLMCDGSAVSRATYSALYTLVGDSFGPGNGSTTFNVPDLRGRFVRGWDHGAAHDPDASSRTISATGSATGDKIGSYQADTWESHSHTLTKTPGSTSSGSLKQGATTTFAAGTITVQASTTGSTETRPKNINVNYIIKY